MERLQQVSAFFLPLVSLFFSRLTPALPQEYLHVSRLPLAALLEAGSHCLEFAFPLVSRSVRLLVRFLTSNREHGAPLFLSTPLRAARSHPATPRSWLLLFLNLTAE